MTTHALKRANWSLLFGGLCVLIVLVLSIAGPSLSPRDPMEEKRVVLVGETWFTAPYPPFTVPGYPLGSDEHGRDILSMLLWAVRPTMVLVAVVAAARLALGTLVGLAAGWSTGGVGRALDTLISAALTAPVLIVALCAVAVLGVSPASGVWAFAVGLAATGWAETARVVREQTRSIKGQLFIEAARALGSPTATLLGRHVLPHVLPLLVVLFAFEISGTILTIAGLGFLGYFTNYQWVMVTDFVAERYSGAPELGQMLSTVTSDIFTGPWKMFAAGSMVFIVVLGFNLVGMGLNAQLSLDDGRRTFFSFLGRVSEWFGERLRPRLATPAGRRLAWGTGAALLVAGLAWGGSAWWKQRALAPVQTPAVQLEIPGGHLWATERRDPYGTLWADAAGPLDEGTIAWVFEDLSGISGGPAVSAEGTVYLASKAPSLYALDPTGKQVWQTPLLATPVGAPALGEAGEIYVADKEGGLSAFSPQGEPLWHMPPADDGEATAGPVVAPGGTIYYTIAGDVQAVSPDGQPLWRTSALTRRISVPARLSPDGALVFLKNAMLDAQDGSPQAFESLPLAEQYFAGADGMAYSRFENTLTAWHLAEAGPEHETMEWDAQGYAWGSPTDSGVLPDQSYWLGYTPEFQDARFVFVERSGRVSGFVRFPHRPSRVIAIDRDETAFVCGLDRAHGPECLAFQQGQEEPVWTIPLDHGVTVNGGALVPDRLYVTLEEGYLFAIGEGAEAR